MFKEWNNSYLISLSIQSEEKLAQFIGKLQEKEIPFSYFLEPDIGNELTSICFLETPETRRLTSSLPLSLKQYDKEVENV